MNPQMAAIFESLNDGVIVVSPETVVRFANVRAHKMLTAIVGRPLGHAKLAHAIEQLAKGYQSPPMRVPLEIDGSGQIATQASLLPSPVGKEYVIVLRDLVEENFFNTTLDNFYAYINADLTEPIERFAGRIESIERIADTMNDDDQKSLYDAAENARTLAKHLRRITDLAQLFGQAPLMAQERLPLSELLDVALSEYANSITARRVELKYSMPRNELPPIYGSRQWLARALAEFLDNAARHTTPDGHVEIKVHATGTHVVLICRNQGATLGSRARERMQVPFNAPPGSRPGAPAKPNQPKRSARIGLAICRKILELHGGAFKITDGDADDIVEFVMELPTGAPTRDTQLLDIAQAQRYASDMARLMARRAKPAAAEKPAAGTPDATLPKH